MKKFLIGTLCALTICLTGCEKGKSPSIVSSNGISPDITVLGSNALGFGSDYNFFYVIDNNTKTVYIMYNSHNRSGMAPALHKDGTPVTIDELERF
jgi:hypothetical protein